MHIDGERGNTRIHTDRPVCTNIYINAYDKDGRFIIKRLKNNICAAIIGVSACTRIYGFGIKRVRENPFAKGDGCCVCIYIYIRLYAVKVRASSFVVYVLVTSVVPLNRIIKYIIFVMYTMLRDAVSSLQTAINFYYFIFNSFFLFSTFLVDRFRRTNVFQVYCTRR